MLASNLIDIGKSKASKRKVRIRWDSNRRWFVSHTYNSYYQGYGDTIEDAYKHLTKIWRELT